MRERPKQATYVEKHMAAKQNTPLEGIRDAINTNGISRTASAHRPVRSAVTTKCSVDDCVIHPSVERRDGAKHPGKGREGVGGISSVSRVRQEHKEGTRRVAKQPIAFDHEGGKMIQYRSLDDIPDGEPSPVSSPQREIVFYTSKLPTSAKTVNSSSSHLSPRAPLVVDSDDNDEIDDEEESEFGVADRDYYDLIPSHHPLVALPMEPIDRRAVSGPHAVPYGAVEAIAAKPIKSDQPISSFREPASVKPAMKGVVASSHASPVVAPSRAMAVESVEKPTSSFKPYTLDQYRDIRPKEYVEIPKMKPDLTRDDLVAKRANLERIKEFSKQLQDYNTQASLVQRKLPAAGEAKDLAIARKKQESKRERALQFAKQVPKPPMALKEKMMTEHDRIVERRFEGRRIGSLGDGASDDWIGDHVDMSGYGADEYMQDFESNDFGHLYDGVSGTGQSSHLAMLEAKHAQSKKQVSAIKASLGLK